MAAPTTTNHMSDADLVAAARQGDRHAFGELVGRYRSAVYGVVYRMVGDPHLADDTAQEAFIKAWQRLHTYKPQYSFRNWMFAIATHSALDFLRGEPETVDVDELSVLAQDGKPEAELESKERAENVRRAVMALPAASRAVLVLREYEGLSYQEISGALNIPVGTVMSRLNYARNQLRQMLAPYMERP